MTADQIAKQIPDEVVIPVAWAIYEATTGLKPGDELYEDDGYAFHWEEAVKALAAALAAWPGMSVAPIPRFRPYKEAETLQHIILPLQEPRSDQS